MRVHGRAATATSLIAALLLQGVASAAVTSVPGSERSHRIDGSAPIVDRLAVRPGAADGAIRVEAARERVAPPARVPAHHTVGPLRPSGAPIPPCRRARSHPVRRGARAGDPPPH